MTRGHHVVIVVAAAAVAVALAPAAPVHASPYQLSPVVVIDGDYRAGDHTEVQGFDGFDLAQLQAGAFGAVGSSFTGAALLDFAAGESVGVVDAWIAWRAKPSLEISAGYLRSPLFPEARDEYVERLAIPELSVLSHAMWPGRNVGVSARWRPREIPIDVWARLANGTNFINDNDTNYPAGDLRADVVLGRARAETTYGTLRDPASRKAPWGIRIGAGVHFDNVDDRGGAAGYTVTGYEFYRPAVVSGDRYLAEGHALLQYEGVQLQVEGAFTREGRSQDTTGNPDAPREHLTSVDTYGFSGELDWMITGEHRVSGAWPTDGAHKYGAVELALRGEHVTFGRCAYDNTECHADVEQLTANVASGAVHWWITRVIAVAAAGYYYHWDNDPYDQPGVRSAWNAVLRFTLSIR